MGKHNSLLLVIICLIARFCRRTPILADLGKKRFFLLFRNQRYQGWSLINREPYMSTLHLHNDFCSLSWEADFAFVYTTPTRQKSISVNHMSRRWNYWKHHHPPRESNSREDLEKKIFWKITKFAQSRCNLLKSAFIWTRTLILADLEKKRFFQFFGDQRIGGDNDRSQTSYAHITLT